MSRLLLVRTPTDPTSVESMSEPHRRDHEDRHGAKPGERARRSCTPRVPRERALSTILATADITDCQLVPWGSNYTFAVALQRAGRQPLVAIYKPSSGEIPLWDFQAGTLYRREYASYLLSRVLGWHFIPETVIRDGPHGTGTVQLYVEPAKGTRDRVIRQTHDTELRQMFLFDVLTNNADRKSSHFFVGAHDHRLWGIDHGLTFHSHPKLRTVIWDYCGDPVDTELIARVRAIVRHSPMIAALLRPYLRDDEIQALLARARVIAAQSTYPMLSERRNIPYGW